MAKSWSTAAKRGPAGQARLRPGEGGPRRDARLGARRDGGREAAAEGRGAPQRGAGAAVRGRPRAARARSSSSSRGWTPGQGRDRAARAGHGGSAGRAAASFGVPTEKERSQHYLQRIREALPGRAHRGVRQVALRGRAGGPRERAGAAEGLGAAVRRDQRVRARGRRRGDRDHQGGPARLARGAEGPAARAARAPGQVLEVQPGRHRRARQVARYQRRTRRSWTGRARSTRPGTRCRRTTSGTRSWRSGCCATALEDLHLGWPAADFDVEAEKARLDAQTL